MGIKLGNIDVSYFKVGGADCSIYLGDVKMYPNDVYYKLVAQYSDSSEYKIECDGTSALTEAEVSAHTTPKSAMTEATIGDCVTSIGNDSFYNCRSLTSITIGDNVTSIGKWAFENCTGLSSVDIPNSVTTIDNYAFNNCSGLTSITIPSGVTSIGYMAFTGCKSFTGVTVEATTPPTLGSNVFLGDSGCPIYVPCESVDAYKTTWSAYVNRITCIPTPPHDYSQDYFTMVALGDNFVIYWAGKVSGNCLSYSLDSGATWSEPLNSFEVTLANSGDTIMLKGSGMTSTLSRSIGTLQPDFTVDYKVQGNIMSLLFGDNFVNQTDLTGYVSAFNSFFQGPSKVTPNNRLLSVENLVLPATTLERDCYHNMFLNCTSLTTAPELPATTLAVDCYVNMFKGCTSLTTAPQLPATTLTSACYQYMFAGCTSLSAITCLATDISASNCTSSWVQGVAASGTFIKAASMTSWTTGNNGIPSGWAVEDYQP